MDGLSVALDEYSQELNARKNAEAEISRLKIELSGQAARLSALTSDDRRREVHRQLSKEITDNLSGLERDLSKLKVERDLTLAEVEELSATKVFVMISQLYPLRLKVILGHRRKGTKRQPLPSVDR